MLSRFTWTGTIPQSIGPIGFENCFDWPPRNLPIEVFRTPWATMGHLKMAWSFHITSPDELAKGPTARGWTKHEAQRAICTWAYGSGTQVIGMERFLWISLKSNPRIHSLSLKLQWNRQRDCSAVGITANCTVVVHILHPVSLKSRQNEGATAR